jgi:transposase InsO family protein
MPSSRARSRNVFKIQKPKWRHSDADGLAAWIRWYNEARPQKGLGYRSPREHRAHEAHLVA